MIRKRLAIFLALLTVATSIPMSPVTVLAAEEKAVVSEEDGLEEKASDSFIELEEEAEELLEDTAQEPSQDIPSDEAVEEDTSETILEDEKFSEDGTVQEQEVEAFSSGKANCYLSDGLSEDEEESFAAWEVMPVFFDGLKEENSTSIFLNEECTIAMQSGLFDHESVLGKDWKFPNNKLYRSERSLW